jgi:putative NADH-flavin reductase
LGQFSESLLHFTSSSGRTVCNNLALLTNSVQRHLLLFFGMAFLAFYHLSQVADEKEIKSKSSFTPPALRRRDQLSHLSTRAKLNWVQLLSQLTFFMLQKKKASQRVFLEMSFQKHQYSRIHA